MSSIHRLYWKYPNCQFSFDFLKRSPMTNVAVEVSKQRQVVVRVWKRAISQRRRKNVRTERLFFLRTRRPRFFRHSMPEDWDYLALRVIGPALRSYVNLVDVGITIRRADQYVRIMKQSNRWIMERCNRKSVVGISGEFRNKKTWRRREITRDDVTLCRKWQVGTASWHLHVLFVA